MPSEKLRAVIGDTSFDFEWDGARLFRNGVPVSLEVIEIEPNQFAVRHDGVNHSLALESSEDGDFALRRVDGMRRVRVLNHRDLLLEEAGIGTNTEIKRQDVRAPMPGLVLKVSVGAGDSVHKGDSLVVLEAMKMENELRASADAVVSKVHVQPGDAVQKNAVLIEFAD